MILKTSHLKTNPIVDENAVKTARRYLESDRTRGATLRGIFLFLLVVFLVSGCVAVYSPAPLPVNHPANPAASEAPPPPPSQAFYSENILPPPAEETLMQGSHVTHGAKHGGH